MLQNISLGVKIALVITIIVGVIVGAISIISYTLLKKSIFNAQVDSFKRKVDDNLILFKHKSNNTITSLNLMADQIAVTANKDSASSSDNFEEAYNYLEQNSFEMDIRTLILMDTNGVISERKDSKSSEKMSNSLYQTFLYQINIYKPLKNYKQEVSLPFMFDGKYYNFCSVPIISNKRKGKVTGYLFALNNSNFIFKNLISAFSHDSTYEFYLMRRLDTSVNLISFVKSSPSSQSNYDIYSKLLSMNAESTQKLWNHIIETQDNYKQGNVKASKELLIFENSLKADWGVLVYKKMNEAFRPLNALINILIISTLLIIGFAYIIALSFAKILVAPLLNLRKVMLQLSNGITPDRIKVKGTDEISQINKALNQLVAALKRTTNFANQIGKGETNVQYQLLSQHDSLGKALIEMRNNLYKTNKEEDIRRWSLQGKAEVSEIIRTAGNNLELLVEEIEKYLAKQLPVIEAKIYQKTAHNFTRPVKISQQIDLINFDNAEGELGTYTLENVNQITFFVQAQHNKMLSFTINSGSSLLGLIAIHPVSTLTNKQQEYLRDLSDILGKAWQGIILNMRNAKLLSEQQLLAKELMIQKTSLQAKTIQMSQAEQEILKANQQITEQFQQLQQTQKRFQVLMENATEIVTIYNKDGSIRYVSPSVEKLLGYHVEELMGLDDTKYTMPMSRELFLKRHQTVLEHPENSVTITISYFHKNGNEVVLESTATNMLHDPAINGILVNARDITSSRLAEREARMRTQMQALSENSVDIISRVNKLGVFYYINPVVERYTGLSPKSFLHKRLSDYPLNEIPLVMAWDQLKQEVFINKVRKKQEITVDSPTGKVTLQIQAIPEIGEDGKIESILLVSHDITMLKDIEVELQAKGKKISESIDYAKRLQMSILPDASLLQKELHHSFILYKPKDVVSGDFPWFYRKGNNIYLAVVDCTGHGVPGAMISLVGNFLLSDISRKLTEPKDILIALDTAVLDTLKSNHDGNGSTDGMDIALFRIDLSQKIIQFAGAHRSLLVMRNSLIKELKGDKYQVGGMHQYINASYTQQTFRYETGDRLLAYTDGFADQFGGPNDKKFSSKRIREIFSQNSALSMDELKNLYEIEFESWKCENRQTDDVLMIGIELQ